MTPGVTYNTPNPSLGRWRAQHEAPKMKGPLGPQAACACRIQPDPWQTSWREVGPGLFSSQTRKAWVGTLPLSGRPQPAGGTDGGAGPLATLLTSTTF